MLGSCGSSLTHLACVTFDESRSYYPCPSSSSFSVDDILFFSFPVHPAMCLMFHLLLLHLSFLLLHHRHHLPHPPPPHLPHPLQSVALSHRFLSTILVALVLRMLLLTRLPPLVHLPSRLPRFITSVLGLAPRLIATLLIGTVFLFLLSPLPIGLP